MGNMRPICEFEKLAFDSKIVWSHGHLLRFKVVIDGVASSTKQQNVQKIDLDVVAFSKRAHIRYVSGKLARVARARRAILIVVAFRFEFALACRAFVLWTIECSHRQSGFGQEPGAVVGGGRKPASPNGPKMV